MVFMGDYHFMRYSRPYSSGSGVCAYCIFFQAIDGSLVFRTLDLVYGLTSVTGFML